MRLPALIAVFSVCAVFLVLNTSTAHAISPVDLVEQPSGLFIDYDIYSPQTKLATEIKSTTIKEEKLVTKSVKQVRHKVEAGETLSSIAKTYDVKWQRIFYKNKKLNNPDELKINQVLVIPGNKEKLKKRRLATPNPSPSPAPVSSTTQVYTPPVQQAAAPRGSSSGNTYYYGYCTWYAKSRRPDLPNNLGNADTWTYMAASQGIATGSTPKVGAIAQQGMHVAYVEKVHSNGTVTISEMNFEGWGVISSRTVAASNFMYIY